MNPDVAAAVPRLVREGILTKSQAMPLLRVAKGRLVSVYRELRLVLYAGVLLVTAGVGVLVVEQLDRIGPLQVSVWRRCCSKALSRSSGSVEGCRSGYSNSPGSQGRVRGLEPDGQSVMFVE